MSEEIIIKVPIVTKMSSAEDNQSDPEQQCLVNKLKGLLDEESKLIDKATRTVLSKEDQIREHCVSLRNKVDTQSEIMHEEIRQWNEEMRNKIDEYEKECLDKFNAEEFETSASLLKFLVAEVSDHQKRVEQELDDVKSDTNKLKELVEETSSRLRSLKREDLVLRSQKFSQNILELMCKKKFDPSRYATLNTLNTFGFEDSMKHFSTIKDVSDFKTLEYCFINPRSDSNELIAIVLTESYLMKLVKLDKNGNVLKEKQTDNTFIRIHKLQAVDDYFIIEQNADCFFRFDYDFNEMEMHIEQDMFYNIRNSEFTANRRLLILNRVNSETSTTEIHYGNHDLSECDCMNDEYQIDHSIKDMIANEKYLFIWYWPNNRVRIADIESVEVNNGHEPSLVANLAFPHDFDQVKLLGDEYIATFNQVEGMIRIYTQDRQLELVREHKISLNDDNFTNCTMSQDSSNNLCFFNNDGDIYHDML